MDSSFDATFLPLGGIRHMLYTAGIRDLDDLAARSPEDLLAIRRFSPQLVTRVEAFLADRGLALAPARPATGVNFRLSRGAFAWN